MTPLTQQDIAILLVRLAQRATREAGDAMSGDADTLLTVAMNCYREASEALARHVPPIDDDDDDDDEAEEPETATETDEVADSQDLKKEADE